MPLVQKPFGDVITFTRASSATMFDSSGTLVYAPMNLLLQSEDFTTTWVTGRSNISPDVAIAPDGATTADALIEDNTAANTHNVGQGFSFTAGLTYTISVFAKATASPRFLQIIFPSGAFGATRRPVFDLVNGTAAAATDTTASIENVGDGWYRCIASMQAASTNSASLQFQLAETYTNSNSLYDGDGTSGIYIWGAQLNQTPMQGGVTGDLSTYYPTTSAAYQGPRLDYDPATLLPRGFLVEEQRTNLVTYSQDLSNAVWTFTGQLPFGSGSIVNDGIAPDGTTTADKVVEDTSTGSHLINYSNITTSTTTTNSLSFFIKAAGRTSLSIRFGSQGIANRMQADINLNTGAVTAVQNIGTATGATCTATLLPNQWWRITASVNPNDAAATAMRFILYPNGTTNYTGDGVSGVYIWGAQTEAGAFSTSYIPTTTTALTRSADVASVNTLSPWFNGTEGTLFVEASPQESNSQSYVIAGINDATASNRITLSKLVTTGNAAFSVLVSGVTQASTNSGAWTATGKLAGAYKLNDFASSLNGSAAATDTSGTIPTVTQLTLGRRGDGGNQLTGYLRRITYYPRRLSNAELQAITA